MEQINKNLGEIRAEFYKNKQFVGRGFRVPPEFELKGYDNEPRTPLRHEARPDPEQETQLETQEPQQEQNPEQMATPDAATTETTGTPEPEPPEPPSGQTTTKVPRALSRLTNNLNGINWNCEPLPGRRRYVAAKLDLYQTPGIHEGDYENTELVPDEEEARPPPEGTENPGQAER